MPTLADVLGVKRQLLPGEEPAPNPDALAALLSAQSEKTLAPNQFVGSALTRQNKVGPDGAVSLDYTPSEYNKQLDTQNAEETAFEQKLSDESRQADAEENDPYIKAARDAEQKDKLALAGEGARVAGESNQKIEAAKAAAQVQAATIAGQAKTHAAEAAAAAANGKFPQQVQTQAIYAGATADQLDKLMKEVDDPDLQPFLGAIAGRITDMTQGKLSADVLSQSLSPDPNVQHKLGQFAMDMTLANSGVARAHNQRGATKELLAQFENQIRTSRDPNALKGAIESAKNMMLDYAHPKAFAPAPPRDPLANTLGMGPKYASTDPNFQP